MYTTLNKIKSSSPCYKGWRTLLEGLGKTEADDEPLHFLDILRINGDGDAFWSLRAFSVKERQVFAIGASRQVQHLCPDFEHLLNMAEAFVLQTPVNGVSPPSLSELSDHSSSVSIAVKAAAAEVAWAAKVTAAKMAWAAEAAEAAWAARAGALPENVVKEACSYVESRIG